MKYILFLTAFIFCLPIQAKVFQNSYVKFELPDRWQCSMEQTEWICRSTDPKSSREAIIILTAKEVGPLDTLTEYETYLRRPKVAVNSRGQSLNAEVKQIQRRTVKGHEWVDGLLLGSEIPNFYTRYLATTKSRVAVLVTFTAHQRHYTKYSKDFFNAIQSLEVLATDGLFNQRGANPLGGSASLLGHNLGGVMPADMLSEVDCLDDDCDFAFGQKTDYGDLALILVVIILIIGGYIVLRK